MKPSNGSYFSCRTFYYAGSLNTDIKSAFFRSIFSTVRSVIGPHHFGSFCQFSPHPLQLCPGTPREDNHRFRSRKSRLTFYSPLENRVSDRPRHYRWTITARSPLKWIQGCCNFEDPKVPLFKWMRLSWSKSARVLYKKRNNWRHAHLSTRTFPICVWKRAKPSISYILRIPRICIWFRE